MKSLQTDSGSDISAAVHSHVHTIKNCRKELSQNYMFLIGYMVSHEWANSSYIFHINPLLQVVPEKDEIEPHEPLREKWRSDLQLLSDYLDFKVNY